MQDSEQQTFEQIIPLVYQQLKGLARAVKSDHKSQFTLNTTALVHDVYLKIQKAGAANVDNERHFFRLAAKAMRQIITDAARAKLTGKRDAQTFSLDQWVLVSIRDDSKSSAEEIVQIDQALFALSEFDEQAAQVVELHFFAGYTFTEVAEILNISESSVFRLWRKARAWLFTALNHS